MTYWFHPEAEKELHEAYDYYESRQAGLGRRFADGLLYDVRGEVIVIVAVMHLHRRPSYWRTRLL